MGFDWWPVVGWCWCWLQKVKDAVLLELIRTRWGSGYLVTLRAGEHGISEWNDEQSVDELYVFV